MHLQLRQLSYLEGPLLVTNKAALLSMLDPTEVYKILISPNIVAAFANHYI